MNILIIALAAALSAVIPENPSQAINEFKARAGACYHCYEAPEKTTDIPAPKGYKPFYISHYGRHGSRYHTPKKTYQCHPWELLKADSLGLLTTEGRSVLDKMLLIARVHEGMTGELSVRGFREHEGIAKRMQERFPEVFSANNGGRDSIRCISSNYSRCILSMSAFTGTLRATSPWMKISQVTGQKYFDLIAADYKNTRHIADSIKIWQKKARIRRFDPTRLAGVLFKSVPDGIDLQQVAKSIYTYGAIAEDLEIELGGYVDLFSVFTPEELYSQFAIFSDCWFGEMCGSKEYGAEVMNGARKLVKRILSDAGEALLAGSEVAADLRFGHDDGLMPLIFLLGLENAPVLPIEGSHETFPGYIDQTASNLQFIFYRNSKSDVIVKLMYNEKEILIRKLKPATGSYYKWNDLKAYLENL